MFVVGRRPIGPDETSVEVERDLAELGADLLLETVDALAAGRAVETAAARARASPTHRSSPRARVPSRGPSRRRRSTTWCAACSPGRWSPRGWRHARADPPHRSDRGTAIDRPAGTILRAEGDDLAVVAGDGRILRILELQPEGRRVMTAREFLAGRRVDAGHRRSPPA